MIIGLILFAIIMACNWAVGKHAEEKGRSFWLWFLFSWFFTPVIGSICVLIVPKYKAPEPKVTIVKTPSKSKYY